MSRSDDSSRVSADRAARELGLVVFAALAVQAVAAYGHRSLQVEGFYYATLLARIGVPLALLRPLRLPLRGLGLRWPSGPGPRPGAVVVAFLVLTIVAIALMGDTSYQAAYEGARRGEVGDRAQRFVLFTLSTTLPWEFFHRGFLLHATRTVLDRAGGAAFATAVAVLLTASFEVLFHFQKPPLEALAFLVASPVLSLIALRTGSLLLPLLLHVWVELLFFLVVVAR